MHKTNDYTSLTIGRKAELSMISQAIIGQAGQKSKIAVLLKAVANEIVKGASPAVIAVSIVFDRQTYFSKGFAASDMVLRGSFETSDQKEGTIEIYFNTDLVGSENFEEYLFVKDLLPFWKTILTGALADIRLKEITHQHGERKKELSGIDKANEILNGNSDVYEALNELCSYLPQVWQHPKHTRVRIVYDNKSFMNERFKETEWSQKQVFETADKKKGSLEIFYTKKFSEADEGPFLAEERNFLKNLAALVAGAISQFTYRKLLLQNTERLKELKGLNETSEVLKRSRKLEDSLQVICNILPSSFQYPNATVVRINYQDKNYESRGFKETPWKIAQVFQTDPNHKGTIEVFYTEEFPEIDEGPFLKEERNLLINLSGLIAGQAVKNMFTKLHRVNVERLKELEAINLTSKIIEESNSVDETLQRICNILPHSWQYPKHTACRIQFERRAYTTLNFMETPWRQIDYFSTIDNNKGSIEIFYLKKFHDEFEGPFLLEERNLIRNICKLVSGYLNSYKGLEIISNKGVVISNRYRPEEFRKSLVRNKKPLQLYFNQQSIEKYVYLDMMKYKVKHILFVSTLYDAFMLESEDSFFEKFLGEIYQYSLFSLPRITGVSSVEEALDVLETTQFDLVILMVGLDRKAPVELSEQIRARHETIPIYLLLNKKSDLRYFENLVPTLPSVDQLFVWNGDSQILFAIVKSIEDRINVENDTRVGLVRVILVIEDSPLYYSKYLQFLYSIVFDQVQQILPEVEKNELDKISRMRSRPKVLLAKNYEEASAIFNKYKDFILCVISDMEFERGGKPDKKAGVSFIRYAKASIHKLPVVLQSSEESNRRLAKQLGAVFLNKNSDTLMYELRHFLKNHLGFGPFVFLNAKDEKIGVAKSLREFETMLQKIPDESFFLHGQENKFSLWLMARGEIQLAKTLNPIPVNSLENVGESRKFFLEAIHRYKEEKKKGRIMGFDETATLDERNIVSFCSGSLGGKGRGLAFINVLIYNYDFSALSSRINISTPITVIIGTNEFQNFINRNNLADLIADPKVSYQELRKHFFEAELTSSLMKKLKIFIKQIDKPIAVRSSSTSEDSITHPFSGVFDTYIIPNCRNEKQSVLEHLASAIKMIYASIYSDDAKTYFEAIHHRVEDEKMAIVLQELVGSYHENYYYPHISGVAQSFNYYPIADMKPEEGFAVTAIGLGTYVVNGWKSYRFSPAHPKVSVYGIKDLLNSTQVKFYALNCTNFDFDLLNKGELATLDLLDLEEAEKHGTLKHCVSVYNPDNDRVEPGLDTYGPRIVNFANILQYDYIPLAKTIETILRAVEEAFGSPVEIEFAVDLEPGKKGLPTFYLLQIKPLLASIESHSFDFKAIEPEKMLLFSGMSLGNGEINKITDVIYIPPERFSKLRTLEMAAEIEKLNARMVREKRKYVLIGPGRWGTRDQFLGIPVNWAQISNAKVIVETSLQNFPLDSSLGSHFFHNVTSMNIGYFSVLHNSATDLIRWDMLDAQELVDETRHFRHVRFKKSLRIVMNGKTKTSAIILKSKKAVP